MEREGGGERNRDEKRRKRETGNRIIYVKTARDLIEEKSALTSVSQQRMHKMSIICMQFKESLYIEESAE
jgi:hypothetical protein